MELEQFVQKVNQLECRRCEKLNKSGKSLFAAVHNDFPANMLELYWRQGFTPQSALKTIRLNAR